MTVGILIGDCREKLRELPDASVNCCVTSPPYFGLRDYGCEGQMGLEPTPDEFVAGMVDVFREVRRVLRDDGVLWLNIGDSYARLGGDQVAQTKWKVEGASDGQGTNRHLITGSSDGATGRGDRPGSRSAGGGLKAKDLIGIPWMLAFALRADGWYLRQDIIWSKPNPMPESVRDRCTKAHEYLFLLSKGPRYHFDAAAIAEPLQSSSIARLSQNVDAQDGSDRVPGKTNGKMKAVYTKPYTGSAIKDYEGTGAQDPSATKARIVEKILSGELTTRNKRSVWEVATQPFSEAHFATYPPALIEPCIKAGCPEGGTVLGPFGGAGTTGLVADRLQRDAILIELNPDYAEIARNRIASEAGMFAEIAVSQPIEQAA
jgi:DNA modification methylase